MNDDSLIRNCKFAFKCPLTWEQLSETGNESVRFCDTCEKDVYLADDADAFSLLALLGKCVAVRDVSSENAGESQSLVGIPETEESFDASFVIGKRPPRSAFSDGKTLILCWGLKNLRGHVPGYCLNDCTPGMDGAVYSIDDQGRSLWDLYRCSEEPSDAGYRIAVVRVGEYLTADELYERIEAVGIFVLDGEAIALGLPFHRPRY